VCERERERKKEREREKAEKAERWNKGGCTTKVHARTDDLRFEPDQLPDFLV
jgi:hypothetical protein